MRRLAGSRVVRRFRATDPEVTVIVLAMLYCGWYVGRYRNTLNSPGLHEVVFFAALVVGLLALRRVTVKR